MANTTNINELPLNPIGGGDNNEIKMVATDIQQQQQQPSSSGPTQMTLDQSTINQIVSGLQAASVTGLTQLPSRDIPRTTDHITQDPNIQQNYIPPPASNDYIKESMTSDEMIYQHEKNKQKEQESEKLYDELQTPLLLAVLYFLFQLPVVRKMLLQYLPVLFSSDGNININGLGFMSISFGLCYYFINKAMMIV
jgi:hypothetical protein